MNQTQIILCLSCVLAISVGQLLFKKAGLLIAVQGSWLDMQVLLTVGIAGFIYSSATILWIFLLKDIPLSKAYMLMAVSFIAVPIASIFIFNEKVNIEFFLGSLLILSGLFVIFRFNQ